MRETRADTAQAFLLALLVHALLFALLFAGLWWTRDDHDLSAAGSPVSAELMSASDLSAAMRRTLQSRPEPVKETPRPPQPPTPEDAQPLPQPLPEPTPQESPVPQQQQAQAQVPEPSPIEQDKVDRNAISEETREREQEEKRRQEQIDLTEQQRQDELKKIQDEIAKTRREADLAQQKLKQIADLKAAQASKQAATSAPPPPGNGGADAGLRARYAAAIQAAVLNQWVRPDSVPVGQRCVIIIRQLPGGEVIDAQVSPSCPYDEAGRRSVEAAVLKAQPLPYAGFESVFARELKLNFEAQDR